MANSSDTWKLSAFATFALIACLGHGCTQKYKSLTPKEIYEQKASLVSVKIQGATEGSGFLGGIACKVEPARSPYKKPYCKIEYSVTTAAHVVKSVSKDDELVVITNDGSSHHVTSISFYDADLDLASLTFEISEPKYHIATLQASESNVVPGDKVFISGFPLQTTADPNRSLRFTEGNVISVMDKKVAGGYQLIYSNSTLLGMSGSPIFDSRGVVLGIHGRGEIEAKMTQQAGIAIKTGQNQGIPITNETEEKAKETIYLDHCLYIPCWDPVAEPVPEPVDAPTEAELQALVQGWLDAKALALSGQPADLSVVARDPLVKLVERERAFDAAAGVSKQIEASITSIEVVDRKPQRIELVAELTYSDRLLGEDGAVIDETAPSHFSVTYVLGRDGTQWRLHAYIPGS